MIDLTNSPEKLRSSIIKEAMQGKLTQQLPEDGNAMDLLKKIDAEKKQLIKDKKIKKKKRLPDITNEEIPFDIPNNWRWIKLGNISILENGDRGKNYPGRNCWIDSGVPFLNSGSISKNGFIDNDKVNYISENRFNLLRTGFIHLGDIAYTLRGSVGKAGLNNTIERGAIASSIVIVRPIRVLPNFINYVFQSLLNNMFIKKYKNGSVQGNLSATSLNNMIIPLPPLSEQERIVNKLDSILPKVQEFNVLLNKLQNLRNNFPKRIKASLLKDAMQGKLTQQLPEDGNAMDLLKEINAEKKQLIKDKKIRKHKALPDITSEEIPFNIPNNWQWVRLRNISSYIQRGKSPKYGDDGIKVLSQKCVQWSGIDISKARRINKETLNKYDKIRYLQNHDILWNSTGAGTLGRVSEILSDNINNNDILVVDSHVTVIRTLSNISHFVLMYLSSPHIQNNLDKLSSGSTKQIELSKKSIENVVIPLPPLEEQKRIVNKLNHLFKVLNLD